MRRELDGPAHRLPVRCTTGGRVIDGLGDGEKTMQRDSNSVGEQQALPASSVDAGMVLE